MKVIDRLRAWVFKPRTRLGRVAFLALWMLLIALMCLAVQLILSKAVYSAERPPLARSVFLVTWTLRVENGEWGGRLLARYFTEARCHEALRELAPYAIEKRKLIGCVPEDL